MHGPGCLSGCSRRTLQPQRPKDNLGVAARITTKQHEATCKHSTFIDFSMLQPRRDVQTSTSHTGTTPFVGVVLLGNLVLQPDPGAPVCLEVN